MTITIRAAQPEDASCMVDILNRIIAIGGTTSHSQMFDADKITQMFIRSKFAISCFVAMKDELICGFQALEWCDPDWPGGDVLPADWAVIATYVDQGLQSQGVGSALFAHTLQAAKSAGTVFIDATIRRENVGGLAYYSRMGFEDYHSTDETISKRIAPA